MSVNCHVILYAHNSRICTCCHSHCHQYSLTPPILMTQVEFEKPNMDLEQLLRYGNLLVDEQENVRRVQLADSYLKGAELVGSGNGAGAKQALLS